MIMDNLVLFALVAMAGYLIYKMKASPGPLPQEMVDGQRATDPPTDSLILAPSAAGRAIQQRFADSAGGSLCPPVLNPQVQQTAAFLERQLQSNQELMSSGYRRIALLQAMPSCPPGCGTPEECTRLVPWCVTEAERARAIAKEMQMIEHWQKLSGISAQTLGTLRACGVR